MNQLITVMFLQYAAVVTLFVMQVAHSSRQSQSRLAIQCQHQALADAYFWPVAIFR